MAYVAKTVMKKTWELYYLGEESPGGGSLVLPVVPKKVNSMAIQDENNQSNQQPGQQPGAQPSAQQGAQPGAQTGYGYGTGQQPQGNVGLNNINSILTRSGRFDLSETRSADALKALNSAREQAISAQTLTDQFQLVRFDRDTNRVGLPSILVMKTTKKGGNVYVIVRTLLLDTEGVRLKPKVLTLSNNERIEIPTRPQDVFNDTYWSRLKDFIIRTTGIQTLTVLDAGPLLIPADFDFKDELAVRRILITSVNRCDDVIMRILGETPFNVASVKGSEEYLSARIDFSGVPQLDVVGHPIRSDIVITMSRASTKGQVTDDFYEAENTLNSVSGFINLEYTPPMPQQQLQWGNQPLPTQLFTPTFIMTDVRNADWIQANTIELYLLAISNAYRLTAGTQWARTFLPSVGLKNDPKDIGALGYLTQRGEKIKTKGDNFTDSDFVELMTTLVKPNPTFLIDANPVGPNSSIEGAFIVAATNGHADQTKAAESIIRGANNLTRNIFGKYFDATKFPVVIPYVDVHLGYYLDEHNDKRDIRDNDVLAVLNATGGNVQEFMNWYRTMCDVNTPSELRLKTRESMERLYLGTNLVITGRAPRLMLTPQFVEALDRSTVEAGVNVTMENLSTVFGAQRFVGNQIVGQYAVSGSAQVMAGVGQSGGYTYNPSGATSSGRLY